MVFNIFHIGLQNALSVACSPSSSPHGFYLIVLLIISGLSRFIRRTLIIIGTAILFCRAFEMSLFSSDSFSILFIFSIISVVTEILRAVEYHYGPRNIPDMKKNFAYSPYIFSIFVRRSRQLFEFIIYTFFAGYIGANYLLASYGYPYFPAICGLVMLFGVIQKVFGSNPSFKGNIYDQYVGALTEKVSISKFTDFSFSYKRNLRNSVFHDENLPKNLQSLQNVENKNDLPKEPSPLIAFATDEKPSTPVEETIDPPQPVRKRTVKKRCVKDIYTPMGNIPDSHGKVFDTKGTNTNVSTPNRPITRSATKILNK